MKRFLRSTMMLAAFVLPAAALADAAGYASSGEETLNGVISSINGKYGLTVRDTRGSLDSVTMHRGTIINPTGLQLKPGTLVTIIGHVNAGTFDADTIDAPVEAANRFVRSTDVSTPAPARQYVPSGTFQTNGPSATGGG